MSNELPFITEPLTGAHVAHIDSHYTQLRFSRRPETTCPRVGYAVEPGWVVLVYGKTGVERVVGGHVTEQDAERAVAALHERLSLMDDLEAQDNAHQRKRPVARTYKKDSIQRFLAAVSWSGKECRDGPTKPPKKAKRDNRRGQKNNGTTTPMFPVHAEKRRAAAAASQGKSKAACAG